MSSSKIEDHINFTARHDDWNVGKRLKIEDDTNPTVISYTLATIGEETQKRIEEYLDKEFDIEKLDEIEQYVYNDKEPVVSNAPEILKKVRGPGTGRKISSITKNDDARTIIKSILARRVLKNLGFNPSIPSKFLKKYLEDQGLEINIDTEIADREHVEFTAKHDDWITVKKEQIQGKTKNIDVALILASIGETAERKIEDYLENTFNFEKLDQIEEDILEGDQDPKVSDMPDILENLISDNTKNKINKITTNEDAQKILKSILTRRILTKFNFNVDTPREELNEYIKKQT